MKLRNLLLAAVLAAGVPIVTAPAAHAGDCAAWVLCGQITNSSRNHVNIVVSNAWHDYPGSPALVNPSDKLTLAPGWASKNFVSWKDVDAYWFPEPCRLNITPLPPNTPHYLYGNVWRKISDVTWMTVTLEGC